MKDHDPVVAQPSPVTGSGPLTDGPDAIERPIALRAFIAEELSALKIDPDQPVDALRQELSAAINDRGGRFVLTNEDSLWVVKLVDFGPEFRGQTIEEALAWCRVYLEAPEYGPTDYYS